MSRQAPKRLKKEPRNKIMLKYFLMGVLPVSVALVFLLLFLNKQEELDKPSASISEENNPSFDAEDGLQSSIDQLIDGDVTKRNYTGSDLVVLDARYKTVTQVFNSYEEPVEYKDFYFLTYLYTENGISYFKDVVNSSGRATFNSDLSWGSYSDYENGIMLYFSLHNREDNLIERAVLPIDTFLEFNEIPEQIKESYSYDDLIALDQYVESTTLGLG